MELPVYKLVINPEDETGVDFVSLVTSPAIERDFVYFHKEEFFDDYPKAASQNAQRGINLNEKLGNDCATLVGKNRARQLVARENLSIETIKRTYSYLSRAKEYYNPSNTEACGTISYLLWGGEEMLRYAERKLEQLELNHNRKKHRYDELPDYTTEGLPLFNTKEEAEAYAEKIGCSGSHKMGDKFMPCKAEQVHSHKFEIQNEEKRIIFGMAMEADKKIYRYDEARGEYYVYFDKQTIFEIAKKWAIGDKYDSVNTHHDKQTKGLSLFESYIVDRDMGKMPPKGYEEVADGSWFLSYIVNDNDIWAKVKSGEFKGFSVEGYFDFETADEDRELNALMNALQKAVNKWNGKN